MGDVRAQLRQPSGAEDGQQWSSALPARYGTPPHVRLGSAWLNLLWLAPIGFGLLIVAVAAARELRQLPEVAAFIAAHPGTLAAPTQVRGIPAWMAWQHFFNLLLMTFIIRSGWQILADHPRLYWTRHCTPGSEWFRFQKQVPADPLWTAKQDSVTLPGQIGLPGVRHSIGLARWWHLGIDMLFLLNGALFYVLLFCTGQWQRIVPTSWQYLPNAASVALQYLSLQWPTEHSWQAYNALQVITYGLTVFVAAPAALVTGLGMSPALSTRFRRLNRVLSSQVARSLHFLVMVWFVVFIFVHVGMVFSTGIRDNLNHMFAARDDSSWIGVWWFCAAIAVVAAGWVAASPFTLRHPRVVQRIGSVLTGPMQRLFEHVDATPGHYGGADVSPYLWHNGTYPDSEEYKALCANNFADYRLRIGGLVGNPVELDMAALRRLGRQEQITQHLCIQGWSGVAKWGGVPMSTICDLVRPGPRARWVIFYSLAQGSQGGLYYDAHPIEQMYAPLTLLAYDMNDAPLSYGHGAPLRLRNEVQLGFKQVKWISVIEFVCDFTDIGAGNGGYQEDHDFYGYRQSI
ncbi:molybdopterin-dependent oxidoreductase [Mycobacterium sp. OAS707]|uniref:molybdopterin-dependent oxidoreductase n=1 Tax=Mycobacterium sp. OAS707 TaxID=2663822 RepID=UPI001789C62F|nr:molybdopterin-dependent oxidoreductase [Mycobacterium sp. OAS707]